VNTLVQARPWLSLAEILRDFEQRLVFIVVLPFDSYTRGVGQTMAALHADERFMPRGDVQNYWTATADCFQGVRATFSFEDVPEQAQAAGQVAGESAMAAAKANRCVTIQFHTLESAWVLTDVFRPLFRQLLEYDQATGAEADALLDDKLAVSQEMESAWRAIPVPEDVDELGAAIKAQVQLYEELQAGAPI
jgi:hypothetical protein